MLLFFCHNPNDDTTQPQHNINIVVGLNMKMTVHTHQRNSLWPQLISNNKQGYNNNLINNNKNNNNININNNNQQ